MIDGKSAIKSGFFLLIEVERAIIIKIKWLEECV